jgi:hypothetical protein
MGVFMGELLTILRRPSIYSSLIHSTLCECKATHLKTCLAPGQAGTPSGIVELNLGVGGSSSGYIKQSQKAIVIMSYKYHYQLVGIVRISN